MRFNLITNHLTAKKLTTNLSLLSQLTIKPIAITTMAIAAFGVMSSTQAKVLFSDTSISLLYGEDYELAKDGELTTLTLEHASAHSWGGVFFFVDRLQGASDDESSRAKDIYGELAPKFKLKSYDEGFVKQVNFAAQYEFGSNSSGFNQDNYMVGVGADLNIPIEGMKYASASLYHVFNNNSGPNDADDQQITLTYGWEKNNFVVDGYVDYSFNNDDLKDQLHINPQIKYNLQEALGIDNRIEVGIEYSYWRNKFGLDGVNQSVPSALVKLHF
ncbi:DUF5020 family protein [uncultured Psychrobacter sp.]|uniref:DUF5020 family protein n=1 Tax=uncultured Psychrobacter sp. TaxID=259303 RepID=UPI0034573F82